MLKYIYEPYFINQFRNVREERRVIFLYRPAEGTKDCCKKKCRRCRCAFGSSRVTLLPVVALGNCCCCDDEDGGCCCNFR